MTVRRNTFLDPLQLVLGLDWSAYIGKLHKTFFHKMPLLSISECNEIYCIEIDR